MGNRYKIGKNKNGEENLDTKFENKSLRSVSRKQRMGKKLEHKKLNEI